MRVALFVSLVLLAVGCKSKAVPPATEPSAAPTNAPATAESAEARFWKWFEQNADALRAEPDLRKVMERVSDELAKVDKGVFAEIGSQGDQRLLVLSVDGNKKLFPIVERLYAARPTVAGWKVVAFRQRDDHLTVIEMNGKKLDPKAMKFVAEKNGELFDVTIYIPGFTNEKEFGPILFIALDHTVGEYDMETRIGAIEWGKIESAPPKARPLAELPKLIDETFAKH